MTIKMGVNTVNCSAVGFKFVAITHTFQIYERVVVEVVMLSHCVSQELVPCRFLMIMLCKQNHISRGCSHGYSHHREQVPFYYDADHRPTRPEHTSNISNYGRGCYNWGERNTPRKGAGMIYQLHVKTVFLKDTKTNSATTNM